jgi:acetone carboxylase gamma subunit
MEKEMRYCVICGEAMFRNAKAIYCSAACSQKAKRIRHNARVEEVVLKADNIPVLQKELLAKDEELAKLRIEINEKCDRLQKLDALIRGYEIALKYKPDNEQFKGSKQRCIDEINSIDLLGDLDKEHLLNLTSDKE